MLKYPTGKQKRKRNEKQNKQKTKNKMADFCANVSIITLNVNVNQKKLAR